MAHGVSYEVKQTSHVLFVLFVAASCAFMLPEPAPHPPRSGWIVDGTQWLSGFMRQSGRGGESTFYTLGLLGNALVMTSHLARAGADRQVWAVWT
eukprot:350699-Chlamydomonas_euryale.AAC.11